MKQIQLTKEEEIKLQCIKEATNYLKDSGWDKCQRKEFVKTLKEKLNVREAYPTIREYLDSNKCGAYHKFNFDIKVYGKVLKIRDIMDSEDFERIYNGALLDNYYVVKAETKSEGCMNEYTCTFTLTTEEKED